MIINLDKVFPEIETKHYNCLVRNGITDYEQLAEMTDYELSKLRGVHDLEVLIGYRDKAKLKVAEKHRGREHGKKET